jgi:hypothetical protein
MNMTHHSEDDLILFFYGEGRRRTAVQAHLDACPQCAALYADIAQTMKLVTAPEPPERDERYGLEVWQRIRPILPVSPPSQSLFWWPTNRVALGGALAALVVAAFLTGRAWPIHHDSPTPAARTVAALVTDTSSTDVSDRMRMAAIGDHLEQSERLLLDFVNAGGQVVDVSGEQVMAADLIDANRLYREAASSAGDTGVADVLDALERSLIEIAHGPSTLSRADFNRTRTRQDAAALLFKVRVLSDELHEREISPVTASKTPQKQA